MTRVETKWALWLLAFAAGKAFPAAAQPSGAEDAVLSGALTGLIGQEVATEQLVDSSEEGTTGLIGREVATEQSVDSSEEGTKQLVTEEKSLKSQQTQSETEPKLQRSVHLRGDAQEGAHSNHKRKVHAVEHQERKLHVVEHEVHGESEMRAELKRTTKEARSRYLEERKARRALVRYSLGLKKELNSTKDKLAMANALLNHEVDVTNTATATLNTSQAQLRDAKKVDNELELEAAGLQEQTANATSELRERVHEWSHDAAVLSEKWHSEHSAVESAQQNASHWMHQAESKTKALSRARGELDSFKQQQDEQAARLKAMSVELDSLHAQLDLQKTHSKQVSEQDHALATVREHQLQLADKELVIDRETLNSTAAKLIVTKADDDEQRKELESALKQNAELHAEASRDHNVLVQQLVGKDHQVDVAKAAVEAKVRELNLSTHSLNAAMDLVKDGKDERDKMSKVIAKVRRTKELREHQFDAVTDELRSTESKLKEDAMQKARTDALLKNATAEVSHLRSTESEDVRRALQLQQALREAKQERAGAVEELRKAAAQTARSEAATTKLRAEAQSQQAQEQEQLTAISAKLTKGEAEQASTRAALDKARAALAAKEQGLTALRLRAQYAEAQSNMRKREAEDLLSKLQATTSAAKTSAADRAKLLHAFVTARDESEKLRARAAESVKLGEKLHQAEAEVLTLNATQTALAKELGLPLEDFSQTAAKEVARFQKMHQELHAADEELRADRIELGVKAATLNATREKLATERSELRSADTVKAKLAEATQTLDSLHKELNVRSSDLNHSRAELAAESVRANSLHQMQQKLNSSEQQVLSLEAELTAQKDELNQTRAKLAGAKGDAEQKSGARDEVQHRLDIANRQLDMTRSELAADSGELNMTRREMDSTLSAVKDLHDMRTRLAAVGEELKAYRSALSGRTSELNATRSELQAAKTLRNADARAAMSEVKELEEMKARLRAENTEFINMRTTLEIKDSALRKANDSASVATRALRTANNNLLLETSKVQELLSAKRQLAMLKMTEASQLEETKAKLGSAQQHAAAEEESAKSEAARADRTEAQLQYAIQTARQQLTQKQEELNQLKSGSVSEQRVAKAEAQVKVEVSQADKFHLDATRAAEQEHVASVRAQQAEAKLQYAVEAARQLISKKQTEVDRLHKNLNNDVTDIRRAIAQMRMDNATKHSLGEMVVTLRTTLAERDALLEKLRSQAQNSTAGASVQSELEKSHGELMLVKAREIAAEQHAEDDEERARKLESKLANATMTLAQDAKLLKDSKESKQRLKDKIKAKYHKMVTKLKDVEAQNKALSQHVADLEGSK